MWEQTNASYITKLTQAKLQNSQKEGGGGEGGANGSKSGGEGGRGAQLSPAQKCVGGGSLASLTSTLSRHYK